MTSIKLTRRNPKQFPCPDLYQYEQVFGDYIIIINRSSGCSHEIFNWEIHCEVDNIRQYLYGSEGSFDSFGIAYNRAMSRLIESCLDDPLYNDYDDGDLHESKL